MRWNEIRRFSIKKQKNQRSKAKQSDSIIYRCAVEAADGIEVLEVLEKYAQDISVILLDMMMPNMDGKELSVIVISAEDSSSEQLGMLKNGVHDYITKPFDADVTRQKGRCHSCPR